MTGTNSDIILSRLMALHPKVIDLTLDRMWRLLEALGHPEKDLPPVIHIAGTNGKGSTQAMIRAGLEAAGHRVHAYTSPHLARFHERIRLAGDLIDEADLSAVLDECERLNGSAPITYFEITTCAALLAFSRVPADFTLLEVGLGGRLDATNVIDTPRVTAITPVSMDHEAFLGDTLEAIAGEKAGIIKPRVPCIVGPQEEAALAVIERQAARLGAPVRAYGQHWYSAPDRDRMVYQDETGLVDVARPALPGDHQIQNAGIAIAVLRELGLDAEACEAAVTQAEWPARMQRLTAGPLVELAQATGRRDLAGWRAQSCGRRGPWQDPVPDACAPDASDLRHDEHQGCDRLFHAIERGCPIPDGRIHSRRDQHAERRGNGKARPRGGAGRPRGAGCHAGSAPHSKQRPAGAHPDLRLALPCRGRPARHGAVGHAKCVPPIEIRRTTLVCAEEKFGAKQQCRFFGSSATSEFMTTAPLSRRRNTGRCCLFTWSSPRFGKSPTCRRGNTASSRNA